MSKNIIIQEAGLAKNLTVDALRLKKQDGGTEDWLPADGKDLVELQIGGSGTYKASDYNAYGIAVVRVTPKYGGGATSKAVEHDFTEKRTPSIKEGNKSRNFSAAMLKTNLQGGGTCLWIPRMDVELKNKYITKSGTYTAKADDCYGFDQVTVSGVDVEITQDDDGDDVARVTDGGETTEEKLPDYIRVTVLPQKLDYTEGETISYAGLVVHAYTKSGIDLGVVPFEELLLPETTAHHDDAGISWASSDLDTGAIVQPFPFSSGVTVKCTWGTLNRYDYTHTRSAGGAAVTASYIGPRFDYVFAKSTPGDFSITDNYSNYDKQTGETRTGSLQSTSDATPFTHNGKTVYYTAGSYSIYNTITECSPATSKPINGHEKELAWSMIYGDITSDDSQSLPVQWNRPYDDRLLETSFIIHVQSA